MLERHRGPVHKTDDALAHGAAEESAAPDATLARALDRWSADKRVRNERIKEDEHEVAIDKTRTFQKVLESEIIDHGVFSSIRDPKTGDTIAVIDEDALHSAVESLFAKDRKWGKKIPKADVLAALPQLIGHKPLITRLQSERGDLSPKPFFYVPESADAATDATAIKNASFQHFITDFTPFLRGPAEYPVKRLDEGIVTELEAKTAAIVFHPQYGDGFRNEEGKLFVRDKATREYVPFSGDFLKSHGVYSREFREPLGYRARNAEVKPRSLREGVAAELPHLVRKGLIRPVDDFKQMTYGRTNVADQRVERIRVSSAGSRMIRGVIHQIGKQFVGKPVRIVDISPTIGAVIDTSNGQERVTHTFNIISREHAKAAKSNMFLAGAPLTQTRPFSAETIALPRRADESLEQYHDRTEKTDRGLAHLLLKVIPKHPELANMLRDKPTYEIASIAQAAYLLERNHQTDRFDEFVSEHGEAGARTFLVTANNDQLREKTFAFAQSQPKEKSEKVFIACGRLIDTIDTIDAYLREHFGTSSKEAVNEVSTKRLKHVEEILSLAYNNPDKLLVTIENANAENVLFLDMYRAIKAENPAFKLEDAPAVQSDIKSGNEILADPELLESINKIYTENWTSSPEAGAELLRRLYESFSNPQMKFYVLSHEVGGKRLPMAFMSATERENSIYIGALNVDRTLVGVHPGRALIEKVSEMGRAGKNIELIAVPDTARAYMGQFGAVANGIQYVTPKDPFFTLIGSKELGQKLTSWSLSSTLKTPQLMNEVTEAFDPNKRLQVLRIPDKDDVFKMVEMPLATGYVVTRLIPQGGSILAVIEKPQEEEATERLAA